MLKPNKQNRYVIPNELEISIEKFAFDIHEFSKTESLLKIHDFIIELKKVNTHSSFIYKTSLGDIVEYKLGETLYAYIINGYIIEWRYIREMDELKRLKALYE